MKTWPSPKITVTDDTLAGRGVVAIADITQDGIVAIKAGHIDDDFYLAPRSADDVDDMSVFVNHSCAPNVGFRGQVVQLAMSDIERGEELCHDYALERSDGCARDCHCGSRLCRGKVSGEDWKLPELQQRYGYYFFDLHQQQI